LPAAGSSAEAPDRLPPPRRPPPWHRSPWFDIALCALLAAGVVWVAIIGATSMGYGWKWDRVPRYVYRVIDGEFIAGPMLKGLLVTLNLSWISMLLALAIGLAAAVLKLSGSRAGRFMAQAYVEIIRNTPILVQMLILYFIVGRIFDIPRFWCGVLCLSLYEGAFAAEIIRGAIVAVRKGQWEAGSSLGLSRFDTYRDVVLPQAIPLMMPPMAGVLVNLVKHSAIVSVIAVFDLATETRTAVSDSFMAFELWLTAAGMYLAVTLSLSAAAWRIEKRFAPAGAR
jgi:polar amino acid transport system permease protein